MGNGEQWNIKWIVGLILTGLIIFAGQRAMTFESRIQVLENEKANVLQRLERIEKKIDRIQDGIYRNQRANDE